MALCVLVLLFVLIQYRKLDVKYNNEKSSHDYTKSKLEEIKSEKQIDKLMEIVCGYHPGWDIPKELEKLWDFWPDYPPDWYQRKKQVYIRDKRTCTQCGTHYGELLVHNIKHLSDRGSNELSNLILLCRVCHEKVHNTTFPEKPAAYFRTVDQKRRPRHETVKDPDEYDDIVDEHDIRANDSYLG